MRCSCIPTTILLRSALERDEVPECPDHPEEAPAQPDALALNDNDGLTAAIAARLGVPVGTDTAL